MFEGIVSNLLTKYLGEYVENLDANALNIAVWRGDVKLKNLKLKPSALDGFDLPITVSRGVLGSLRLIIPWKSLSSSPVVAEIDDVYIVVKPKKCTQWNEKQESERKQAVKQKKLETYEMLKEKEKKKKKQNKKEETEKKDPGFLAKLTETVVNNVQIRVQNVHLRYEDFSDLDNPIVLGFTLEKLVAFSVDENWQKTFITKAQKDVLKLIEMGGFALYMNYKVDLNSLFSLKPDFSSQDFIEKMMSIIQDKSKSNKYILKPINGTMKLKMQHFHELDLKRPRVDSKINFEEVSFVLDKEQYKNILQTLDYLTNYSNLEEIRRLRPNSKPTDKETIKQWWKFATDTAILDVSKNYFSWKSVQQRMKDRKDYIQLYKRKKGVLWVDPLEGEDLKRFEELEKKLSYEDIILFRQLCEAEIEVEREKNKKLVAIREEKKKQARRWFSWGSSDPGEEPAVIEITPEQRQELYKTIGYDEKKQIQKFTLPSDYVKFNITFELQKGSIQLINTETNSAMIEAVYSAFTTNVQVKEKPLLVKVTLGSFDIFDRVSKNTKFEKIISRRLTGHTTDRPLASVEVETNPLSGKSDLRVDVTLDRIDVVVNIPLFQKIASFFIIPKEIDLSVIQIAARKQLTTLQHQAQQSLKLALETKKVLDVSLSIEAPNFFVPENCDQENTAMLLLDLGQLQIKSEVDAQERKRRLKNQQFKEEDYYDIFKLNMSQIQVLVVNFQDWKSSSFKESKDTQLLEKVSFAMQFSNCITPENEGLPRMKFDGSMSSLKFNISPFKLEKLMGIANNFLILVDNPTGTSNTSLKMREYLYVKGPVNGPDKDTWKKYWVELRQDQGLLLYESESSGKPIARIDLSHKNVKLEDKCIQQEKPNTLAILLPQADGSDLEFIFSAEATVNKLKWVGAIRDQIFYYNQLHIAGDSGQIQEINENTEKSDQEETASGKQVIVKASFKLEALAVLLSRETKEQTEDVSELKFAQLVVELNYRAYDMELNMQLHSLTVSDLLGMTKEDYIIKSSTEKEKALAKLNYLRALPKSEKYSKEADQILTLMFHQMHVYFDPSTLSVLVEMGYDLLAVFGKLAKRQMYFTVTEKHSTNVQKDIKLQEAQRASMKLCAVMDTMSLTLVDYGSIFARLMMNTTSVNLLLGTQFMDISGAIGDLQLKDCSEDTKYVNILGLSDKDGSLIRFTYKQSMNSRESKEPRYTKSVTATMSSVEFVFLQRLIRKLQAYFVEGPLMDALKAGGTKVAQLSRDAVKKQAETTEMLHYQIKLVTPRIVIPASHKTDDRFVANLGTISIENSLEKKSSDWVEKIAISLKEMHLKTNINGRHAIMLDNTDLNLDIQRAITNTNHGIADLLLNMTISDVGIKLSQLQYQLVFRMIDENFGDTGGVQRQEVKPQELTQSAGAVMGINKESKKNEEPKDSAKEMHPSKPVVLRRFKINFPRLDLVLLRAPSKYGIESPLAQLDMKNLEVVYTENSDKSSVANVLLEAINAVDKRPESNSVFKNFISMNAAKDAQKDVFIDFSFHKSPESLITMNIIMGDPRIIFVPEVVLEIKDFFVNTRPTELKRKHTHQHLKKIGKGESATLTGDLTISSNTFLGEDIFLSSKRKMYIASNKSGEVIIDGQGHKIEFAEEDDTPLVYIADGMTLKMKNIVLKYKKDWQKLIKFGNKSKIVAPSTQGVVRIATEQESTAKQTKETKVEQKKPEEVPVKMIINGVMGKPAIILPETASDPNSRMLILELGLKVKYAKETPQEDMCKLAITDLKMFVESGGTKEQGAPMIEPVSITAEYSSIQKQHIIEAENEMSETQTVTQKASIVKVKIDREIHFRISYQDVKLITHIVNQFTNPPKPDEQKEDNTKRLSVTVVEKPQNDDPDLISGSDNDSEFEDAESDDERSDGFEEAQEGDEEKEEENKSTAVSTSGNQIMNEYAIHFESDTLSILLVDDIRGYDIPLLDFRMDKLLLDANILQKTETSIAAKLSFYTFANYYNMRIAEWEPIIETWGCDMAFERTPTSVPTAPFTTKLHIQRKDNLVFNINVTQQMLDTIMTTTKLWSEGLKGKSPISTKFQPYAIKNHTGVNVDFWIERGKRIKIEPGKELSFDFPENRKRTDQSTWKKSLVVNIQLEGCSAQSVDVRKVGKTKIRNDNKRMICYIDIELIEGRKIITLRSGVKIFNRTTESWEIGVTMFSKLIPIGTVKEGESIGVPFGMVEEGILHIRPTSHPIYNWSEAQSGFAIAELMKNPSATRILTCMTTDQKENSRAFYSIINVKTAIDVDQKKTAEYIANKKLFLFQEFDYTIELRPPLAVENLLGCPLEYTLYDKPNMNAAKMEIMKGTLKRGEKVYVYSANLRNLILLKTKPPDQTWSTMKLALIYQTRKSDAMPLTSQLAILDKNNKTLTLYFDYLFNTGVAYREVMVYCPYWIINHTGQKLLIKENNDLIAGQDTEKTTTNYPLMFSFKPSQTNKKISVSVNDSEYSRQFGIDNPGTSGNLELKSKTAKYNIGVYIGLGPGKFKRTKVITFSARYVLVNRTKTKLSFKQYKSDSEITLDVDQRTNFYWPEKDDKHQMLCVKITDGSYDWSAPFAVNTLSNLPIKLLHKDTNVHPYILNVHITEEMATVFICIEKPEKPPYIIDNRTDEDIQISQINVDKWWTIKSQSKQDYCFDDPTAKHQLIIKIGKFTDKVNIEQVSPERQLTTKDGKKLFVSVRAKGPTRVLRISSKNYKDSWEIIEKETYVLALTAVIAQLGISLINNTPCEIAYISMDNLFVRYSNTDKNEYVEAKIGCLQIDNQLRNAPYPVLFRNAKNLKESGKPFIHFSMTRSLQDKSIHLFPYLSILIQEAQLEVDYSFITTFISYIDNLLKSNDEEDLAATDHMLKGIDEPASEPENSKKFYFDLLELHPIKLHLSFKYNKKEGDETKNPALLLLDGIGITLANIDEAPIRLNALIFHHLFASKSDLQSRISKHYIRAITREFYMILGSLDVIGNPIGLFSDIGTGVKDLFYEPASAITKSPEEVMKGIYKGSLSFFTNSVHGTFHTLSKVTGTLGKGISLLTFDKDYIKSREKKVAPKSKDIKEGVLEGTDALAKSVFDAATGIFTKPISGAKEEGFGGFIKGVGKGLIGIPVKPVAGLIDFATKTTEGISNVKNYFESGVKERRRYPRTFSKEGALIPYSRSEAFAAHFLGTFEEGRFKNQECVYYCPYDKSLLFLTNVSLICAKQHSTRWQLEWKIDLNTIQSISNDINGGIIIVYTPTEKLSLFAPKTSTKRIHMSDDKKDFMRNLYQKLVGQHKIVMELKKAKS